MKISRRILPLEILEKMFTITKNGLGINVNAIDLNPELVEHDD